MRLGDYIAAPRAPFDYVRNDCCRWVAGWVRANGHPDPMAGIDYDSQRSALLTIRRGGGLVALWSQAMTRPVTDAPEAGDVGVIARLTDCGLNEAAAIYTGTRWVTLGLRGLDYAPADVLRAWRL